MSNEYLNAVGDCLDLPTAPVMSIAKHMANRANKDGELFPSVRTLADDTRYSRATVKRVIQYLKENAFINVVPQFRKDGSQTSNLYKLNLEKFKQTSKKVYQAVSSTVKSTCNTFMTAVKMSQEFCSEKIETPKPASSQIGTEALKELPVHEREIIINRLKGKPNENLQNLMNKYGLEHNYVQKAIFNEVKKFKKEQKKSSASFRKHQTTQEKLSDRSWAEGLAFEYDFPPPS